MTTKKFETVKQSEVSLVDMLKDMQVENIAICKRTLAKGVDYSLVITFQGGNKTPLRHYEAGWGMKKIIIPCYVKTCRPVVPKSMWGFIKIATVSMNIKEVWDDGWTQENSFDCYKALIDLTGWKKRYGTPRWIVTTEDGDIVGFYPNREDAKNVAQTRGLHFAKRLVIE